MIKTRRTVVVNASAALNPAFEVYGDRHFLGARDTLDQGLELANERMREFVKLEVRAQGEVYRTIAGLQGMYAIVVDGVLNSMQGEAAEAKAKALGMFASDLHARVVVQGLAGEELLVLEMDPLA